MTDGSRQPNAIDAHRATDDGGTSLLLAAATEAELAPLRARLHVSPAHRDGVTRGTLAGREVALAALGVGKARSAAGLAWALAATRPAQVLLVGVGGAYVGSFLSIGHAVLSISDVEIDLGIAGSDGFVNPDLRVPLWPGTEPGVRPVPLDPVFTEALATAAGVPIVAFATQDAVTSDVDRGARIAERYGVSIESMEGAAAAAVAERWGVPIAQLRVVSNVAGERDRARWDLPGAIRRAADVVEIALRSASR